MAHKKFGLHVKSHVLHALHSVDYYMVFLGEFSTFIVHVYHGRTAVPAVVMVTKV